MVQTTLGDEGPPVISVSELNHLVKDVVDNAPHLQDVLVRGEISNMYRARSGHAYFSLKDDSGEVRCVMWANVAASLPPEIGDGTAVLARGKVGVYTQRGQYQLYVEQLQPEGEGLLAIKLQQLKQKLEAEGLFDPARKRPLPRHPRRVGIVTSRDGAALRDVLHVLRRRAPYLDVTITHTLVQGDGAPPKIVKAIERLGRPELVDVLIVTRGGGSIEDLWAFNEEIVVRAVADCPVPVICGIGHETDWVLAELAADQRVPTPSAAAETVAPSRDELLDRIDGAGRRMATLLRGRLELARSRLDGFASRPVMTRPDALFAVPRQRIDEITQAMPRAVGLMTERARARLERAAGVLDALSPLKTLARGFSVALVEGRTVRSVDDVDKGGTMAVRVPDGTIETTITDTKRLDT